uniref:Hedgehog protein n=1 Tax=Patella vulgata TaxID=6465 RepID=Q8MWG6_PATVU|nr:hedgehog [Patella vulgata]
MKLLPPFSSICSFAFIILFITSLTHACGPGRGSGSRRKAKKHTPLVFKQNVPNVSENSLGASGMSEGRIKRDDAKFKDLVRNHNADIVFKNEEGDGSDYHMTRRCQDKLNSLAVSVMNNWKGVMLRVTEAWNDNNSHAKDSLHYEGRAVDITTSDKDRAKYGMLARLAVEAGFDWVYYESRGHIHCSVKSDSSVAIKIGGCFPGTGVLQTETGWKTMSQVVAGDSVLSMNSNGKLEYSPVIAFIDRNERELERYITLHTEDKKDITLTSKHLIYMSTSNVTTDDVTDSFNVVYADDVIEGDYVLVTSDPVGEVIKPTRVLTISEHTIQGVYAPLTLNGNIVVDGVVVSCYAVVSNANLAHVVFAPVRGLHVLSQYVPWLAPSTHHQNFTQNGVHWYAKLLYNIGSTFLSAETLHVP